MSTTNSKAIQPSTAACCGTNDSKPASKRRQEWSYTPAIDAYELPDAYVIEVDAPGVRADGIDLTFEAGVPVALNGVHMRKMDNAELLE